MPSFNPFIVPDTTGDLLLQYGPIADKRTPLTDREIADATRINDALAVEHPAAVAHLPELVAAQPATDPIDTCLYVAWLGLLHTDAAAA